MKMPSLVESSNPIDLLKALINIFKSKSIYIIGAGVSASYIELHYSLYSTAKKLIKTIGIYPIKSEEKITNEEFSRISILGGKHILQETDDETLLIDNSNTDIYDYFLKQNPDFFKYLCALTYSLSEYPKMCPEYQIFNLINPDSIIINFNHDGLAEHFINPNLFKSLPVHGKITPQLKSKLNSLLSCSLDINVSEILLRDYCLATHEIESNLIKNQDYIRFIKYLHKYSYEYMVIIGYSFFTNNFGINDIVTYNLINSYISNNKNIKIVIINPNSSLVSDLIANECRIQKISNFNIYWNKFVNAYYLVRAIKENSSYKFNYIDFKRLIYFYINEFNFSTTDLHILRNLLKKSIR
jgi:hypothetical protein